MKALRPDRPPGGDGPGWPRLLPVPIVEDFGSRAVVKAVPWPVQAVIRRRRYARSYPWWVTFYIQGEAELVVAAQTKMAAIETGIRLVRQWVLEVGINGRLIAGCAN